MSFVKNIKSGANLASPKPSLSWGIGATIAVVCLMAVVAAGVWVYKNSVGKLTSGSLTSVTSSVSSTAANLAAGTFGDGT